MKMYRKYHLAAFLFLALALQPFYGQAQSELKRANDYFNNYEFALAIPEYQKALGDKEPTYAVAQKLAHAYRLTNRSKEAEFWFAKAITFPESEPINIYYYAEALRSNGNYDGAKIQYQAYAAKVPAEAEAMRKKIQAVESAIAWLAQPPTATVTPETALNSPQSDFSPLFFDNGLLFVSDRGGKAVTAGWTGRSYLQLFQAKPDKDKKWAVAEAAETYINTSTHSGPATHAGATNNTLLYFTRTFVQREKKRTDTDPTSWTNPAAGTVMVNRLAIYQAEKRGGKWGNLRSFTYNKVAEYSVGHPALSPDGKTLYFVSDMPGGRGQTDIYYCERRANSTWGKPVNAGPAINTSGRESFPFLDANGALYFASDGHPGMGGLDIFSAKGSKASWRQVTNLKSPINSPKDDFGIALDKTGKAGYLSSNRDAGDGTDDIYRFELLNTGTVNPALQTPLAVAVKANGIGADGKETSLTGVQISIQVNEEDAGSRAQRGVSNAQGNFYSVLKREQSYTVKASKNGYADQSQLVETFGFTGDTLKVQLQLLSHQYALSQGKDISALVENIYFDVNKTTIRPDAARILDELAQLLKQNPKIKLELSAHTDYRESQQSNLKLSQQRAEATVNYLAKKGIARGRLTPKGYGNSRLLHKCEGTPCTPEERQRNRRVEFKVK